MSPMKRLPLPSQKRSGCRYLAKRELNDSIPLGLSCKTAYGSFKVTTQCLTLIAHSSRTLLRTTVASWTCLVTTTSLLVDARNKSLDRSHGKRLSHPV